MLTSMVSAVSFILGAQQLTKAPVQWQRQHLLDRPVRPVPLIVLAPSRRTADHDPVRCPITRATEARGIHERFHYVDRMRVTVGPNRPRSAPPSVPECAMPDAARPPTAEPESACYRR